jgi:cytochrome c oxidase subunit 1
VLTTAGASILAIGLSLTVLCLGFALVRGPRTADNPWHSRCYEWLTASPPPTHNFSVQPAMDRGPYDYAHPEAPRHGRENS